MVFLFCNLPWSMIKIDIKYTFNADNFQLNILSTSVLCKLLSMVVQELKSLR